MLRKFLEDESGATAIEYGLIVVILSLAIIAGFNNVTDQMLNNFDYARNVIEEAGK